MSTSKEILFFEEIEFNYKSPGWYLAHQNKLRKIENTILDQDQRVAALTGNVKETNSI